MADICSSCGKEVRGGFDVYERTLKDGTPMVVVDTTPDRNFNVCDSCNILVCFHCSEHPDSGYCNTCYAKIYSTDDD
jgi:uncharacterized paraquat-inducible protein A